MYHTDPISFSNILKDIPARKLPENVLQDGLNILFEDGKLMPRYGIADFGASALNDKITGISLYRKLRTTDGYVVAFTCKDIYVYDLVTGSFKYKTRNYTTGKVTSSGSGNRTVTLSTGTWDVAWNQVGLYEISFDSNNMDDCHTWYLVDSISSSTVLTIADTDNPNKVTSSNYCLRLCYSGKADDSWHTCYPYQGAAQDRIIMATNGIDEIQIWDGTGYFKNFDNYPHRAKYVGFFGSVGWEHVIIANYYDTVNNISFEQTIQWLDAGEDLLWNGNYAELIDNKEAITGVLPLGGRLLIYKTGSITIATPNASGGNVNAFHFSQNVVDFGTPSIRTVVNAGQYHIVYTGYDIRIFDGFSSKIISEGNTQHLVKNVNREYVHRSFAFIVPEKSLYCLFLPFGDSKYCNICIVFNYLQNSWSYWKFSDIDGEVLQPMSKGLYQRTYSLSWQDLLDEGVLASEMNHRWRDLVADERYSRMLFGDSQGKCYEFAIDFIDDAGNDITAEWTTKDHDLNMPGYDFRLLECTLMLQHRAEITDATIDIRASVDFGRNWTQWITVPLDGHSEYMEKKVYFNIVGKQVRFHCRTNNPLVMESMTIGFNAQYKSMKFDN